MDFADISADLIDDFALSIDFLLCELEHSEVLLAQLLCRILFMGDFLNLHCQTLLLKLQLLDLPRLLLQLAVFSLGVSLELAYLVVQVLDTPEKG